MLSLELKMMQKKQTLEQGVRMSATREKYGLRSQTLCILNCFLNPKCNIRHQEIGGETNFQFHKDNGSKGEYASLELLWTVKLAEFAFKRDAIEAMSMSSSFATTQAMRKKAERSAQGVLIIDGLFSNLSDEDLIDLSLGKSTNLQSNLQIIGFLHPPHYQNNFDIFPRWIIGKPARGGNGDGNHVWTQIETKTSDGYLRKPKPGDMIVATIHGKHKNNKTNDKPQTPNLFNEAVIVTQRQS